MFSKRLRYVLYLRSVSTLKTVSSNNRMNLRVIEVCVVCERVRDVTRDQIALQTDVPQN